jgi:hypothetical protein
MNTNTPETDAECGGSLNDDAAWPSVYVASDFARRLERERDEARAQHAADVAELNTRLIDRQRDMMDTIVMLRTAVRTAEAELSISNGERDHYRRENAEMREAINESSKILQSIQLNDIFEETMRNHAILALSKFQPFLKP